MKCNPQRTVDNKRLEQKHKEEEQEQEYINSLSEEEREKYLQQKEENQKKSVKMLSQLLDLPSTLKIDEYY